MKTLMTLIISVGLTSLMACTRDQRPIVPGKVSEPTQAKIPLNSTQNTTNLVALFFLKKDNLKNEFSGEIYPIALLLNGRYMDVSQDVSSDIRSNALPDRILTLNNPRTYLNAIQNFTVISDRQKLGDFQVEKPIISQFSCSSMITGQGKFQGQTSLQTVFDQIPKQQESRSNGYIRSQRYDQTWRSAIAVNQVSALSKSPAIAEADRTRYRQDILALGKTAIAKVANGVSVPGEAMVESIQVVDLDQDGSPEIFGKVKQGPAPQATGSQRPNPTGFAAVWVSYKGGQLKTLETIQASVSQFGSEHSTYDLLDTIDLNGDGIDEVIAQRIGYESISFEIYGYKNNQLDRVFSGAGYGC
jgi:hypothetical protein